MANDLKSWAEAGARARLLDIHTETTTILRIFPDLRKGAAATIRRRRAMSQAERKAVGERMRKYLGGPPPGEGSGTGRRSGGTTCTAWQSEGSRTQDRSPNGNKEALGRPARRRTSQRRATLQVLMAVQLPCWHRIRVAISVQPGRHRVFLAHSRAASMSGSPVATISSSTVCPSGRRRQLPVRVLLTSSVASPSLAPSARCTSRWRRASYHGASSALILPPDGW